MRATPLVLLLFGTFLIASCGSGDGNDGSSDRIRIDGSSTVYPLSAAVAEKFRKVAPEARITVGMSGTGGGFKKFVRGETAINDASRQISPSERKKAKKNNIEWVELKVAFDGIAVVAHPKNDWVEYVTVEDLRKMWRPEAQGKVTQWSDVRSEWPDRPLNLYGPGVASGTYDYFTEAIVGKSGASRGDYTASEDDNVLVQGVASDPNALGFFGLAYYEENSGKLRLIPVDNGKGPPVKPTTQTVMNNTYKPLSRPLYIYVRKEAAQRDLVQKFVKFYLNNADSLAKDVGYVAMPDSLYQVQLEKFKAFASDEKKQAENKQSTGSY